MRILTLTTDFGLSDGYAAAMKGVILSIAPAAVIVDISHEVPPRDILAGALLLEEACPYFPRGTIHVAVVDPGVGSSRAALAVETGRSVFIGPDNGIFDLVLKRDRLLRAVRLSNPRYQLQPVSATFHGRDIFAPAAAHLAAGMPLEKLGEPIQLTDKLRMPKPVVIDAGTMEAHVLRIDRFGNLITDLTADAFQAWHSNGAQVSVKIGARILHGIQRTFSDVATGKPVAYFGSGGRLEVALRQGCAERFFKAALGARVILLQEN